MAEDVVEKGRDEQALWEDRGGTIMLRGVKCDQCGNVLFPPQHYGCEACGADETHLEEAVFASEGTLDTFTTVHVHHRLATPFKVAEVRTAASQPVRARLEHSDPKRGDAVVGCVQLIDGTPCFVFVPRAEQGA